MSNVTIQIKSAVRRLVRSIGYDVSRFVPESHPAARRERMFASYEIDTLLDVGANRGQFAQHFRTDIGYEGRIVSFEPLRSAFAELQRHAQVDPLWETYNLAIGDTEEQREINISENSYSSSILNMLPSHLRSAPSSRYIGKERITIKPLDSIFPVLCDTSKNIFLKVDVQGFEDQVLRGAAQSLRRIDTVQLEMSLVPLYEGERLLPQMCALMADKGYALVDLQAAFCDPTTSQLLQVDGLFRRQ